jgi:hypothetical protein
MRLLHKSACLARDHPTQADLLKIHLNVECATIRVKISPLFELARVLVRLDHVASFIANANDSIVRAAEKLCVSGLEAAI